MISLWHRNLLLFARSGTWNTKGLFMVLRSLTESYGRKFQVSIFSIFSIDFLRIQLGGILAAFPGKRRRCFGRLSANHRPTHGPTIDHRPRNCCCCCSNCCSSCLSLCTWQCWPPICPNRCDTATYSTIKSALYHIISRTWHHHHHQQHHHHHNQ